MAILAIAVFLDHLIHTRIITIFHFELHDMRLCLLFNQSLMVLILFQASLLHLLILWLELVLDLLDHAEGHLKHDGV